MAKLGVSVRSSRSTTTLKPSKITTKPARAERLASKGRPKRKAAATHFFKYQLASNPSRAEENDLKRALQESLEEQNGKKHNSKIISSTNSSDVSRSNNSSSSNESVGSYLMSASQKRTRSTTVAAPTTNNNNPLKVNLPVNKRAKLRVSNGHPDNKCDGSHSVLAVDTSTALPHINMAIKTYSRSQTTPVDSNAQFRNGASLNSSTPKSKVGFNSLKDKDKDSSPKSHNSSSVSKSTQTTNVRAKSSIVSLTKLDLSSTPTTSSSMPSNTTTNTTTAAATTNNTFNSNTKTSEAPITPDSYLKFKRESKNYAYVKMTALKVSTSKSPSSNSKSAQSKKLSPNGILHNKSTNKDSSKVSPKTSNNINGGNSSTFNHINPGKQTVDLTASNLKTGHKHPDKHSLETDVISNRKSPLNNSPKTLPQNRKSPGTVEVVETNLNNQALLVGKESIPTQNLDVHVNEASSRQNCSQNNTTSLSSSKNQNQASLKVSKKRSPQGSWSLIGIPEEKIVYLRDDEPPKRLICYPAIKHIEGDVIQVKDSVLLRSGARKTDLPYIAKVCSLWEDAESGSVMMSLFWYYRPEHTEDGRKPHHLSDEIFASRHRDVDSVECIEDKCYVLTFNEYCRYRKRCKMEQVNTTWSLTDVTIPMLSESYPRRNRIPDSDVNQELVFCCRQIYDTRTKRPVKNPLINPKYGHI